MNPSQQFSAPWATLVKIISTGVVLILLALAFIGVPALPAKTPAFIKWLLCALPVMVICGTLPFVVRGYVIGPRELEIIRLGWSNRIPLTEIVSVQADPLAMNGSLRLCGSGGMFGFFGWFRNGRLGVYRAYCTDLSRCVVVKLRTRTIVVSPYSPERFVAALNERISPGASA